MRQIGGVEARRLSILFAQLFAQIGPFILSGRKALAGDELRDLITVVERFEPEKIEPLWKAFAGHALAKTQSTTVDLSDVDKFDDHFAGEMWNMWMFFVESAKLNFGGFLERMFAELGKGSAESHAGEQPKP
jgi:hypothetical protein